MSSVPIRLRQRRRKAALLDVLRARIGAIEHRGSGTGGVLPFGVDEIDSALPWGGLPLGGLHEVVGGADGAAAGFCAALLGRLCANGADGGRGVALWCLHGSALSQAGGLYGPGLRVSGLDPDRVIVVRAGRETEVLWAMEEGLRCVRLAAVLGEARVPDLSASRRLQLAAEATRTTAFLLRRGRAGAGPTAALTRWRLTSAPSASRHRVRWRAELIRCRGGRGGEWTIEWNDETGDLTVVSGLRDGPAVPRRAGVAR